MAHLRQELALGAAGRFGRFFRDNGLPGAENDLFLELLAMTANFQILLFDLLNVPLKSSTRRPTSSFERLSARTLLIFAVDVSKATAASFTMGCGDRHLQPGRQAAGDDRRNRDLMPQDASVCTQTR